MEGSAEAGGTGLDAPMAAGAAARRRGPRSRIAAATAVGLLGLSGTGCALVADAPGPAAIATTTMLGDITARVARCGDLDAETLMSPGTDPHDFGASAAQVADLVRADLVVANGLGLEEGLQSALAAARQDGARVLEVGPLLTPLPLGDRAGPSAGHEEGALDPHVWLDVARMAEAARLIGVELADATGNPALTGCGEEVAGELMLLDAEVRSVLDPVPEANRVLITDHAAFGYFAEAYGFEVPAVVVPGGSTLAAPSSAELTELAHVLREGDVRAVFANAATGTDVVDALAAEVGDVAVVPLHVGSVGPAGSGAEDYRGMMLTDARLIVRALTG